MKENQTIRVFARKTSFTPIDDLAFYEEPPLFDVPNLPVRVSVTFTWDRDKGQQLYRAWACRSLDIKIGGPAIYSTQYEQQFTPGLFLRPGVTITSRGCPKDCKWCLVKKREGDLQELEIKSGYIIQDNNLLACSNEHFQKVCDMLSKQKEPAEFKGGLDIDYLYAWHVDLLREIRVKELWVACDRTEDLKRLDKAADLLSDFPINKKRCYVLIGRGEETLAEAESRCAAVYEKGFLPFAQLYRSEQPIEKSREWKQLVRKWSRPAIYRSKQCQK